MATGAPAVWALVWAKVSGFPWWPGQERLDDPSVSTSRSKSAKSVTIDFLAEDTTASVPIKNVKPYVRFRSTYKTASLKACRTPLEKVKLQQAIAEAESLLTDSLLNHKPTDNTATESSPNSNGRKRALPTPTEASNSSGNEHPHSSTRRKRTNTSITTTTSHTKHTKTETTKSATRTTKLTMSMNKIMSPTKKCTLSSTTVTSKATESHCNTTNSRYQKRLVLTPLRKSGSILTFDKPSEPSVSDCIMALTSISSNTNPSKPDSVNNSKASTSRSNTDTRPTILTHNMPKRSKRSRIKLKPFTPSPAKQKITTSVAESPIPSLKEVDAAVIPAPSLSQSPIPNESDFRMQEEPLCKSSQGDPSMDTTEEDDEELQSLDDLMKQWPEPSRFDPTVGDIIWAKIRRYPWWPVQVISKSSKGKRRIKFINWRNCAKGLSVTLNPKNFSKFPGINCNERMEQCCDHPIYGTAIRQAVSLSQVYLRMKEKSIITSTNLLYPDEEGSASLDLDEEMSEITKSPEPESTESTPTVRTESVDSNPAPTFSDETKKHIEEREDWLRNLLTEIKSQANKDKLMAMIKSGGEPFVEKAVYLGPFSASQTHLDEDLLAYVMLYLEMVTGDLCAKSWVYTYLIPQLIINAIRAVNGVSEQRAIELFINPQLTEQEDLIFQKQLDSTRHNRQSTDSQGDEES